MGRVLGWKLWAGKAGFGVGIGKVLVIAIRLYTGGWG